MERAAGGANDETDDKATGNGIARGGDHRRVYRSVPREGSMISLPIGLVKRIIDLLGDIAQMKPGFEIYETSKQLTIDLMDEIKRQQRLG